MLAKRNKRHFRKTRYKGITFKSKYEAQIAKYLDAIGAEWAYEPDTYEFTPPKSHYTPDFKVKYPDGTEEYLEVKGYLDPQAKMKMKCIREQYPDMKITMHFMRPFTKVTPRSPYTYIDWAEDNGYKVRYFNEFGTWCEGDPEVDEA